MYIKKLAILFLAILFTCLTGCSYPFEKDNKDVVLPIKKEIGNYIFEIEDTKLFKDYILFKYTVTTKDGSEINDGDACVLARAKDGTISFGIGPGTLFAKKLKSNKVVDFSEYFIGAKKGDSINIEYLLGGIKMGPDNYTIDGPYLKESKENYDYINKRFFIDNMDLVLQSKGDFEFGSLIHFYIENITDFDRIPEDYSIKISSGNYENSYRIRNATACGEEENIDRLIKEGGYREGIKSIGFYKCPLIYDNKKIDPNNIKIYLVNNKTKVETLLYSK